MYEFEHSIAVVIGINQYQNGISQLRTAANDAKVLAETLELEHSYQVKLLLDQEATLADLRYLLQEFLPQTVHANDRCLFYFAGHGIALNGDDGPEGFLIPQDAQLGKTNTYLPMAELHDALASLPCRHFLGIFDCCFAGAFRWSSNRDLAFVDEDQVIHKERYDRFIRDPAWQVITSAAYNETALDAFTFSCDRGSTRHDHSPFAAALIEALKGGADAFPVAQDGKPAGDGVITACELYLYLRERVEQIAESIEKLQTPGIWPLKKHDKGEFMFLTPGHELNLPPAPPLDESKNPYRGLESYDEAHSDLFFGRAALTEKLSEFVQQQPLTVVLGASGSGKSSIVKAGLIPALKHQDETGSAQWSILPVVRLGKSPLSALNNALSQMGLFEERREARGERINEPQGLVDSLACWSRQYPDQKILLVIDQSEELITLCEDAEEQKQFLRELQHAIATDPQPFRLVLTLRSDFEPQLRDSVLAPYWGEARFVVPAMTREELRQAIEEPASKRVMYFDPHSLVDQLIDEVAQMPGALPLLSFTLSELYLKYLRSDRDNRAITQEDYEALGGVMRSLTQRADEEYQKLVDRDPAYEHTIRHVMLRLVAIEGDLARRRAHLSELEYLEPENTRVKTVIEQFSNARLLVQGQDPEGNCYVEPAHDALVNGWQRLLKWRQAEQETLILQRRLTPAAEEWNSQRQIKHQQAGRYLWNADPRLALLKAVLQSPNNWFNGIETEFVQRSLAKRRQNKIILWSTVSTIIAGLTGLTTWAALERERATLSERATLAQNQLSVDPVQGLIQTIEIANENRIGLLKWVSFLPRYQDLNTVAASLGSAIYVVREADQLIGHENAVLALAYSPYTNQMVSTDETGQILLWTPDQDEPEVIGSSDASVWTVAFHPNGKQAVIGGLGGAVDLWDLDSRSWQRLGKHDDQDNQDNDVDNDNVYTVAVDPKGRYVFSGGGDGKIRRWDLNGGPPKVIGAHDGEVYAIAIHPHQNLIVSGGLDGKVRLWDLEGRPIRTITTNPVTPDAKPIAILAIAIHPDGDLIAAGDNQGYIRYWKLDGTRWGIPFKAHEASQFSGADVASIAFHPKEDMLVSGSYDQTIRLWNLEGNSISEPFEGHEEGINVVAFDPSGHFIASGSDDTTIRLWDWNSASQLSRKLTEFPDDPVDVIFAVDGETIASLHDNERVSWWNWNSNHQNYENRRSIRLNAPKEELVDISVITYDAQKNIFVTGSYETGRISLWNQQGRRMAWSDSYRDPADTEQRVEINALAISPDGTRLISVGRISDPDRDVLRLWRITDNSLTPIAIDLSGAVHQADDPITTVGFSVDNQAILIGTEQGYVSVWDIQQQKFEVTPFKAHRKKISAIAFNGTTLFTASEDKSIRHWDQEGVQLGSTIRYRSVVEALMFHPDDPDMIVGAALDGTVEAWHIDIDRRLVAACQRLTNHPVLADQHHQHVKRICQRNAGALQR